jgi:hypothetical protein
MESKPPPLVGFQRLHTFERHTQKDPDSLRGPLVNFVALDGMKATNARVEAQRE